MKASGLGDATRRLVEELARIKSGDCGIAHANPGWQAGQDPPRTVRDDPGCRRKGPVESPGIDDPTAPAIPGQGCANVVQTFALKPLSRRARAVQDRQLPNLG